MTAPAFDPKTTFPNQDNFKRKLPSEEELKLQIEQLKRELQGDRITLKRLIVGTAYFIPLFAIILFTTWFVWH
jgi:hypothetical protein